MESNIAPLRALVLISLPELRRKCVAFLWQNVSALLLQPLARLRFCASLHIARVYNFYNFVVVFSTFQLHCQSPQTLFSPFTLLFCGYAMCVIVWYVFSFYFHNVLICRKNSTKNIPVKRCRTYFYFIRLVFK